MEGNSLDLVNSSLESAKGIIEERDKIKRSRNEQEKEHLKNLLAEEEILLPKRKEYHDKIFQWRDLFIKTDQFNQICELMNKISGSGLTIFRGGWGHEIPYETKRGCWSQLYLETSGNLKYSAGYKWMGVEILTDLLGRYNQFSPLYLKEISDKIDNGEIYKTIASGIENRSKLFF